jgi:hypothetical protein
LIEPGLRIAAVALRADRDDMPALFATSRREHLDDRAVGVGPDGMP